jgi:hypothetical protein
VRHTEDERAGGFERGNTCVGVDVSAIADGLVARSGSGRCASGRGVGEVNRVTKGSSKY